MFDRIQKKMRELIRKRDYVVTLHAEEEMSSDNLSIFDIERGILTGKIIERQKEKETSEWKYLIKGETIRNCHVVIVTKISVTGKLVIITVFLEE